MRLPYVISRNTPIAYENTTVMKQSPGELPRRIVAEDFTWGEDNMPPSLKDLCLGVLSTVFDKINPLPYISQKDIDHLMELYPNTIELKYSVPFIKDEEYWKRCFLSKWPSKGEIAGDSWKGAYLSESLREYLEISSPDVFNAEEAANLARMCRPYVTSLSLSQLQLCNRVKPNVILNNEIIDTCPYSVQQRYDHAPLEHILAELTNLREVCLVFGVNDLQERYEECYFEFSSNDIDSLCKGLGKLQHLSIIRINRSKLDCKKCKQLLRCLFKCNIEEIDFSHCLIGNHGAKALAGFMKLHHALRIVNISNNRIGDDGIQGLAYCLQSKPDCPLEELNMRLNKISYQSTIMLAAALVRSKEKPAKLGLSACGFRGDSAEKIVGALSLNRGVRILDLSANDLSGAAEDTLIAALEQNRHILDINLQLTRISSETQEKVNELLQRNAKLLEDDVSITSDPIPPLYLNEPEYLIWEYNPNNPNYIPGIYPVRIAEA